ncbi:MAG TPA: hypothetical protein VN618_13265 [Solirubrobacteraceae bacterium]|nr:hypothetical protein [Solirubrobacteraceae bacterium]
MDPDDVDFWDEHPDPTEADVRGLCEAWARYQARSPRTGRFHDEDPDSWAAIALHSFPHPPRMELEWSVIVTLCELVDPEDDWTVQMIGASPLEDFIDEHGDQALDLIEPAADQQPVLLAALRAVWPDEHVEPRIARYLSARGEQR